MRDYLIISILITALFAARRLLYGTLNHRDSRRRSAFWHVDVIVLAECLVFFNPMLFRFIVIRINIDTNLFVFIYVSLITACFLVPCVYVQKELKKSHGEQGRP